MYLSILNINTPEMSDMLKLYVHHWDNADLSSNRPSLSTRRTAALAIARMLLTTNQILPSSEAELVGIKHHDSGEPFLTFTGQEPLHISISHSGPWIACLISSTNHPACIDLEMLNRKRNYITISENHFSALEIQFVETMGEIGFYKIWTAKEALAKLKGKGLNEALKIHLDPEFLNSHVMEFEHHAIILTQVKTDDYFYTIAAIAG